jgi:hypothetical protein
MVFLLSLAFTSILELYIDAQLCIELVSDRSSVVITKSNQSLSYKSSLGRLFLR